MSFPDAYRADMSAKESEPISLRLKERAERAISETGRIPATLLYKISFYPEVAEALLCSLNETHGVFGVIASSNPEAAFRMMVRNYDRELGAKLEILLLSSPESSLKMLEWSFATKTPLHYGENAYLHSVYEDFSCAWAYHRKFRGGDAAAFLNLMKEIHCADSPESPQGAFYRLCFDGVPMSRPTLNIVKLHPKISLMTAVLFPECPPDILLTWSEYPVWAYNIMSNLDGLPEELAQNCMQTLVRALPWLYQYLTVINQKERENSSYNRLMSVAVRKWKDDE